MGEKAFRFFRGTDGIAQRPFQVPTVSEMVREILYGHIGPGGAEPFQGLSDMQVQSSAADRIQFLA